MSKRFLGAAITAALLTLAGLTWATTAGQHPPDLPLNLRPDCTPFVFGHIEIEPDLAPTPVADPCHHLTASVVTLINHVLQSVTGGRIEVDFGEEQEPMPVVVPEIIPEMPSEVEGGCLTYEWDGWTGSCRKCSEEPPTMTGIEGECPDIFSKPDADDETECPRKLNEARELFRIGERCCKIGHYDMAKNCFQEVQRLCPGSQVAQLAQIRIKENDFENAIKAIGDWELTIDPKEGTEEEEQPLNNEDVEEMVRQLNEVADALAHHLKASKKSGQHDGPCYDSLKSGDSPCCPFGHMIQASDLIRELDLQKLKDAHSLYLIGERCRRNGDPDLACQFYQEAIEVCPSSRFAHKARMRVGQIAMRKSLEVERSTEEQEVPTPPDPVVPEQNRQSKAEEMFRTAERYDCAGDLLKAYVCYQEAHVLCPESTFGRQAIERMAQIEQQQASETQTEEQEQVDDNEDAIYKKVTVTVKEQPGGNIMFGVGINGEAGIKEQPTGNPMFGGDIAAGLVGSFATYQKLPKAALLFGIVSTDEGKEQSTGSITIKFGVNGEGGLIGSIVVTPKDSDWATFFSKIGLGDEDLPSPRIEVEMIEALDRVLQEVLESLPRITITPVESSTPPATEGEEEQEPQAKLDGGAMLKALTVRAAVRHLRLVEDAEEDCCADGRNACLDLSDVLRQAVASRPKGVELKIDAARLGRLISEGENALRCLDCELIADGEGRSYVVYPATTRKR